MADSSVSVRYRVLEGHACPRCAERGTWTHLRWLFERVTDHNAPGGYAWRVKPVVTKTSRREFRDDTKATKWVKKNGTERPVELWEHKFHVECPRCGRLFNRETYALHVFEDSDLPLDYWADHEANLALMDARGISAGVREAHERVLAKLGMRRPQDG